MTTRERNVAGSAPGAVGVTSTPAPTPLEFPSPQASSGGAGLHEISSQDSFLPDLSDERLLSIMMPTAWTGAVPALTAQTVGEPAERVQELADQLPNTELAGWVEPTLASQPNVARDTPAAGGLALDESIDVCVLPDTNALMALPGGMDLDRAALTQALNAGMGFGGFGRLRPASMSPAAPPTAKPNTSGHHKLSTGAATRSDSSPNAIMGHRPSAPSSGHVVPEAQQAVSAFTTIELEAIRADFPILHQRVNGYPLAWLDNAATTQKPNAVIEAISAFYRHDNSNVHRGAHTLAARATDAYENARSTVQRLLKAKSAQEIVFVRGTTEAINLVAQSYGRSVLGPGDEVLVPTLEHHANIVPWQMVCREKGATLRPVPITDSGEIDLDAYMRMLGPKTRIVALAHVSNTLGTVLPVHEMTAMAHAVGARVLIDGAQGVSHMPVDVCSIGCDFYAFSGHKLFGPTGVGALYGRYELLDAMPPWQGGGNMIDRVRFEETTYAPVPAKFEAGTSVLAGAVGLAAAIDYVEKIGMERIAAHEHGLVECAMSQLAALPGLRLFGTARNKVSVTAFLMEGIEPEKIGQFLDSRGIAVRVGHHCAQPTMDRYGVRGMVRPSFAFYNSLEEVDRLMAALYEISGRKNGIGTLNG